MPAVSLYPMQALCRFVVRLRRRQEQWALFEWHLFEQELFEWRRFEEHLFEQELFEPGVHLLPAALCLQRVAWFLPEQSLQERLPAQ